MIQSALRVFIGLISVVAMTGCVSVPRDAGFGDVAKSISDRTGHRIHWNRGTPEDRLVADLVEQLLSKELGADDAIQIALLNNQGLQVTYEDLGIAQAELVEGGLLSNPTLKAEVRFPKHQALPFEFDVTQSFLDLLTLPLRKRASGAAFEAAKQRVTYEVLNTAADVKAAFYRVQGSEQLVELRRNILAAAEASTEAAGRLREAGNLTDLAYANEKALSEQAKVELAKAERDALDLHEELSALLGVWGHDTEWTVAPRLPDLPTSEETFERLESLAISRRADLGAARQDVQINLQNLGLTRYAPLGDVMIGGHLEKDADGTLTVGPSLEIPLPVFNQGQPAVAAAQARLRQSQHRFQSLAVQTRAQVRRARNKMTAARDLAEYFRRVIVPLRHQIVQQNQLHFNAMQIGVFELLQAKQSEIDAGRDYVQALQDYWIARTDLEKAVGGRLPIRPATTQPLPDDPASVNTEPAKAGPSNPHHHDEK